jgi:FlaA1/EpsC-like NDP-sugar epimerase
MLNKSIKYPKWVLFFREKAFEIFSRYSLPRWMVFLFDILAVVFLFFFAYLLRYNFNFTFFDVDATIKHAIIALVVYGGFSLLFHSYSGLIRHTTLTDISLVFAVTSVSAVVLTGFSLLCRSLELKRDFVIPLSVILIHYGSVTVFLFFFRVLIKVLFRFATSSGKETKKVLIYGAGELGFVVKRVILSDPDYGFNVAGFIENDKNLQGKKINGIPVFGPQILSKEFLKRNKIETLIIAVRGITVEEKSGIIRRGIELGLEVLDTPEVDKWMTGQLQSRKFQKVKLEDLLGRDPIELNMSLIREELNDKVIMVTGGAGSIGSEIVRQLSRFNSRKVILIDQAETPLFHIGNELKEKFMDFKFQIILADVSNQVKMAHIFREHHPDIIFHAAAYKHVSLMEENPHEAIRVNVGGTRLMTELAIKYNVGKFVMISTDKSINPTSVMGASKRICEKVVQAKAQQEGVKTQFIITRFGNVLGSNGSVIPTFSRQIEKGGPVTVTHPEVKRYFMTIPEACELVLEAGFIGNGGEIFVFDMGKPVKIADLANQMIRLSGLIPGEDIEIVYTGLRPGEKLFEELLTDNENTIPTHHPKIRKARVEELEGFAFIKKTDILIKDLYTLSDYDIIALIKTMVPEYESTNMKYFKAAGLSQSAPSH